MKKELRPCKVGTQSWLVKIFGNKTPIVGGKLRVKKDGDGEWMDILVDCVREDGYFFAALI